MKNQKKQISLLISIDTECDKGKNWIVKYPFQYESIYSGINSYLLLFCKKFSIKPTFFISPEIFFDKKSCGILSNFPNCELATHLHSEYIPPDEKLHTEVTSDVQTNLSIEIEYEKLFGLTKNFFITFGFSPISFRAGRFGLSKNTISVLSDLKYMADSSVTPFRSVKFDNGQSVNYWGSPVYPYITNGIDPRVPTKKGLLEVPISTSIPKFQRYPLRLLRFLGNHPFFRKKLINLFKLNDKAIYIRPMKATTQELIQKTDEILNNWPKNHPRLIHIMFHSVELIANASPAVQNNEQLALFQDNLEGIVTHLLSNYSVDCRTISEMKI